MLTFGSFSFTAIAFLIVIETQAPQDLLKLSFRCYKNAYIALHRTRKKKTKNKKQKTKTKTKTKLGIQ